MTDKEMALFALDKFTQGTFDLEMLHGDKHENNRQAIIYLLTGTVEPRSACGLSLLEHAVKQCFNIMGMQDVAWRPLLARLCSKIEVPDAEGRVRV